MFGELIGHGHDMWNLRMTPKSTKYLYFVYSVFGCFVMSFCYNSVLFAFLVATPYEKPLDTAEDVLAATDQVYICRGGTDQVYFSTTTQPQHQALFLLANSTKYG